MSATAINIPFTNFASKSVRAGHYPLAKLGVDARGLVDQALSGSIEVPDGSLLFRPRKEGGYAAAYEPFHALGLQSQQRFDALMLKGGDRPRFRHQPLDWELKAHAEPYYGLAELLAYYDLGQLDPENNAQTIEVIATGVAVIDRASRVDGTQASIGIALTNGLQTDKVRLGYRVVPPRGRVERSSIEGGELKWTKSEGVPKADVALDVPAASLVDCTVSYDGYARHHWWVTDPSRAQNPRRAAYEAVDPGLTTFGDYITKTGRTPRDQHDFSPQSHGWCGCSGSVPHTWVAANNLSPPISWSRHPAGISPWWSAPSDSLSRSTRWLGSSREPRR